MAYNNVSNNIQNIKTPVCSNVVPGVYSWTVEYMEQNKWKKKGFLDVNLAYDFYRQIRELLSKEIIQTTQNKR